MAHQTELTAVTSRDDAIASVEATIVDVPLRRPHFHATGAHAGQSYVIVRLRTHGGAEGAGEGVTPGGGAFWGGESVETIKAIIDVYLAPAVIGTSVFAFEALAKAMDRAAAANPFAKAAVEMAAHDCAGRILGVPVSALLGGRVRESIPVLWSLASADRERDLEDAREKLAKRLHSTFKLKIGKGDPAHETARAASTCEAILAASSEARCTVDLNQAWDEQTAARYLPELEAAGVALVEQPVAAFNIPAMARLAARLDMAVMADEGLWSVQDAFEAASRAATDVIAVKVAKSGGLRPALKTAAVAEASGLPCWGGMALESSLGSAASLQLFSALRELSWGCEIIGPLLVAEDLTNCPIAYGEGVVHVPSGPGLGVEVDWAKVRRLARR